jgi:hypothetical protein
MVVAVATDLKPSRDRMLALDAPVILDAVIIRHE